MVVISYTGGTYKLKVLKLRVTSEEVTSYTCGSCKLQDWKSQVTREKVTIYTNGSCRYTCGRDCFMCYTYDRNSLVQSK